MRPTLIKLALTMMSGCLAAAYAAPATTIEAAAQKAISSNPEVQAAWHSFQAATDAQRAAVGGYLPKVDLGAYGGYERYEIRTPGQIQDFNSADINLTITQMLYDGFATSSNVDRLTREKRQSYFALLDAAETATLDTVTAYEDVLRYRELVALAKDNLDRHREVLQKIQERVAAGISRAADNEQATGRFALAQSNLMIEQSNLHDVSARYQRIVGEWPADSLAATKLDHLTAPGDLVSVLKAAYTDNPKLLAAEEGIRAAEQQLRNRKSLYQPRVDLQLRGEDGHDIDRIPHLSNDLQARVLFSYNLYNGGADAASVSEAKKIVAVAEDKRETACRDIRQTVRIAYDDRQRLTGQLQYLKIHRDTTEKARAAYYDQFQIGQRTLLDLLDTQNEYFQAERSYVIGSYDFALTNARTLAGEGRIRQALGVRRSDEPTLASLGGETHDQWTGCPDQMPEDAPTPVKYIFEAPPTVAADSDHDGVPDSDDLCPNTPPGTPVDKAGCPYKAVVELKGVHFAYKKADLSLGDSVAILDNAARILGKNPSMKVEIAGHTDNIGGTAYNLRLSQARANTVRQYLISKGVAPDQLKAVGYGKSQPKVSNATDAGRATNRRTEFRILENAPGDVKTSD